MKQFGVAWKRVGEFSFFIKNKSAETLAKKTTV